MLTTPARKSKTSARFAQNTTRFPQFISLKSPAISATRYIKGLEAAYERALAYLLTQQAEQGGFGYATAKGGRYQSLTGIAMLCFQMWGQDNRQEVAKAAAYVRAVMGFRWGTDLYMHYYLSQAMMQRGGDLWREYNQGFRDEVLNHQNKDGSWDPGGQWIRDKTLASCFCILMLEVYYRFLSTDAGAHDAKDKDPVFDGP